MTDRFERFSFITAEIHRLIYKLSSDVMAEFGLKGAHAIYLLTLQRYPKGVTSSRLSELCFRNRSDTSRAMNIFLDAGLIIKKGENKSYRAPLVLTEKGLRYATLLREKSEIALSRIGDCIPEEKRANLYESLEIISKNLKEITKSDL